MFRVNDHPDPEEPAIAWSRQGREMRNRISILLLRAVYGPCVWLMLAAAVIPTLVLLLFTPTVGGRRRVAHCGARVFFLLIGGTPRVDGIGNLPQEPCVVVANHASYLDGIILKAALPPKFTFLIKAEMSSVPLAGFLLRRIGSAFVDREDDTHRLRTGRQLLKAAMSGESLGFFPEGTFDGKSGLKPFLPGAFAAAWRAKLPVVPVVISGSRHMLPAKVWLCAPGRLSVTICAPVEVDALHSATELAAAARRRMLERLGEPDLEKAEQR